MQYENPQPREGINVSNEHPLKEFTQLLLGVAIVIVLIVLSLNLTAGFLAQKIPFKFEQEMVAGFELSKVTKSKQQQYLQELADKLVLEMDLPEGMQITVHYNDDDTVNAFATLGGNLIFFKGLIDKIDSEQELSTVIAHEIAHIKNRHPIVALGKGLTLAVFATSISGSTGSGAGDWLIGSSANLSLLKYSRDQESVADADAAKAINSLYGNIGGANELFEHFNELESANKNNPIVMELFQSHPYSEKRWQQLQTLAAEKNWQTIGELTKLEFPAD